MQDVPVSYGGPRGAGMIPPPPGHTQPAASNVVIEFRKQPGLTGLVIVNLLLTMITLGIYSFWAKTEVRKHIWSSIHINGEPLEYTGRGMELFLGMLIVGALIIVPLSILQGVLPMMISADIFVYAALQALALLLILFLVGVGTYRAWRYRMSRTRWRGIRGTLAGSPTAYGFSYFWRFFVMIFTLGWAYPWWKTSLFRLKTNDMRFGDVPFRFEGSAASLYAPFATVWIGAVLIFAGAGSIWWAFGDLAGRALMGEGADAPDLGLQVILAFVLVFVVVPIVLVLSNLLWVFYKAAELRLFGNRTSFGTIQFRLNVTVWSLITLAIGNVLIMLFTLGIGLPFVQRRLVRYVVDRLETEGTLDINAILQSQQGLDRTGEGIAEAFDIDGF